MKHVLDIGRELVEDVDGTVDQDCVRSGDENSGACVVLIRPPEARHGGGSVVAQKLTIGRHHSPIITSAPDSVQKSVAHASLDGFTLGP